MKTTNVRKDRKTGLRMATVTFKLPLEIAEILPALAKLEGHSDPDYLAFYALKNYAASYDGHPCDDQPTDDEQRAYGFVVKEAETA